MTAAQHSLRDATLQAASQSIICTGTAVVGDQQWSHKPYNKMSPQSEHSVSASPLLTAHSSHITAHSSQLTAHSSQLTAHSSQAQRTAHTAPAASWGHHCHPSHRLMHSQATTDSHRTVAAPPRPHTAPHPSPTSGVRHSLGPAEAWRPPVAWHSLGPEEALQWLYPPCMVRPATRHN